MTKPRSDAPPAPSLGVIVPAFNEAPTIAAMIDEVLAQPCVEQVVVVDDCSTDGTYEAAQQFASDPRVDVQRHDRNRGKGAAIRTGLDLLHTPLVIIQDADLEYDPADYARIIEPILEGRADVVYGVRGFASQTAYSYWFVLGNRLVTTATNLLFNCYIKDMETGFKAMRTDLMRRLGLTGSRFNIEPEITGRLLRLGYRIHEVPITYYARSREEGKKLSWVDGVKALGTLVRIRLTPGARLPGRRDPYHGERLAELAANRVRVPRSRGVLIDVDSAQGLRATETNDGPTGSSTRRSNRAKTGTSRS